MRRANAVQLGRQRVRDGIIRFQIQKRRKTDKPKILSFPVLPALQAAFDLAPKDKLTFLNTSFGRVITANGFGNWFKKRCKEAACRSAQPIFSWDSPKEAARYRKKAEQI